MKNGKLLIVGGEKTLLVSHLSSFSYVEAEDEVGTPFQALSIASEKRVGAPMSSLKDAQKVLEEGTVDQWGHMVEVSDNKGRTGLGSRKAHQLQDLKICNLASVAEGSFMAMNNT